MTASSTLIQNTLDKKSIPGNFTSVRFAAINARALSHEFQNEKFNAQSYDETGLDPQSKLIARALDDLIDNIIFLEKKLITCTEQQKETLKKLSYCVANYSDHYLNYKNNIDEKSLNNLLLASEKLVAMHAEIETNFKQNKYAGLVAASVCLLGLATLIGGLYILATVLFLSVAAATCTYLITNIGGLIGLESARIYFLHRTNNTKINDIKTNLNLLGKQHAFFQTKKESSDVKQNIAFHENSMANRKS